MRHFEALSTWHEVENKYINMIWSTVISSWLLFSIAAAWTNQVPLGSGDQGKPNIVFILTDDQDVRMNSLDYMPNLQKYLVQEGTTFTRHYATCPSRVSLWTGKAAHNTNVTDVNPPYGKYYLVPDKRCCADKQVGTPNL